MLKPARGTIFNYLFAGLGLFSQPVLLTAAQKVVHDHRTNWWLGLLCLGAIDNITATVQKLDKTSHEAAIYLMPMGFKRRSLFKMGWNEIDYIGKLRTGPGRHLSYWKIALRMVEEAKRLSSTRTKYIPTKLLSMDTVYER